MQPGMAQPGMGPSSYPVEIEVHAPERLARWRPLVNWILVIPMEAWLGIIQLGLVVAGLVGWFAILFTGRLPESLGNFIMGYLRYQLRVSAYYYGLADRYPGFSVPAGYIDPGDLQSVLYSARPVARNRLTVFFRGILVLPQIVVWYILGIAAAVVAVIAWFAVLFTGRWPQGLRNFFIGYLRWTSRLLAYMFLVVDQYPPFGLSS